MPLIGCTLLPLIFSPAFHFVHSISMSAKSSSARYLLSGSRSLDNLVLLDRCQRSDPRRESWTSMYLNMDQIRGGRGSNHQAKMSALTQSHPSSHSVPTGPLIDGIQPENPSLNGGVVPSSTESKVKDVEKPMVASTEQGEEMKKVEQAGSRNGEVVMGEMDHDGRVVLYIIKGVYPRVLLIANLIILWILWPSRDQEVSMFIYIEIRKENCPPSYTPVLIGEKALRCRKSGVLNLPYFCLRSGRDLVYQLHQTHHPGDRASIPARAFVYRH